MKPEKDNIKNIFSSKLQNFEPELPPLMWEKIDAGLSAQKTPIKAPARKISIYRYSAAIGSVAALIAIAFLLFSPKDYQKDNFAVKENKTIEKADFSKSEPDTAENSNKKEESVPDNNYESQKSFSQSTHEFIASLNNKTYKAEGNSEKYTEQSIYTDIENDIDKSSGNSGKEENIEVVPEILNERQDDKQLIAETKGNAVKDPPLGTEEQFEKQLGDKITDLEAYARQNQELLADNYIPQNKKKAHSDESSSNGFNIGAGGGGAFSKGRAEQMQLRKVNYALMDKAEPDQGNDPVANDMVSSNNVTLFQKEKMNMKHNQPITFGITISKNITDKLSLETGITYTYLSSKFKSDDGSDLEARDSQVFHYFGIPLTANYRIFEWNKLQLYVSAGGAIQKDFYGRMKTYQNAPALNEGKDSEKKNISQKNPQLSVNTSLGLSYPIYNKLSLYTNVGGAYYFDAKNDYETIYSDRKWHLNLNAGIRFAF